MYLQKKICNITNIFGIHDFFIINKLRVSHVYSPFSTFTDVSGEPAKIGV